MISRNKSQKVKATSPVPIKISEKKFRLNDSEEDKNKFESPKITISIVWKVDFVSRHIYFCLSG